MSNEVKVLEFNNYREDGHDECDVSHLGVAEHLGVLVIEEVLKHLILGEFDSYKMTTTIRLLEVKLSELRAKLGGERIVLKLQYEDAVLTATNSDVVHHRTITPIKDGYNVTIVNSGLTIINLQR